MSLCVSQTITNDPSNPPKHDSSNVGKHCTTYSSQDGCLHYPLPKPVGELPSCGNFKYGSPAAVFGIVGDYGLDSHCAVSVAELFENVENQLTGERGFDFVLSLGDNAYWDGQCESYRAIAQRYYGRFFPKVDKCSDNIDQNLISYQQPINDKPYGGLPANVRFFPTIG